MLRDIYTISCVKLIVGSFYITEGAQPGSLCDLERWDGSGEDGDSREEKTYI